MIANNMQTAVAQVLRACGRTTLAGKPLAVFARRTFFVTPSYKARLAARGYATATATKTATTTKAAKTTTAAKKPSARSAKATGTKKTATAKKAAKPKAKKKVAKKPVKKAKREVNPETKKLLLKRSLKKKALLNGEPKQLPVRPWIVFLDDHMRGATDLKGGGNFGAKIKGVSAQWKNLSDADKQASLSSGTPLVCHGDAFNTDIVSQELSRRGQENKITNAANYKKWVEAHTIAEITAANHARSRLVHEFELKSANSKIHDERMPKRPLSAFGQFFKAKSTGTVGPVTAVMRSIGSQWKSMSDADKKPYYDLWAAEKVRFTKEMEKLSA